MFDLVVDIQLRSLLHLSMRHEGDISINAYITVTNLCHPVTYSNAYTKENVFNSLM